MAVEPFEAVSAFVAQVEKKYAYVTDTAYTDVELVGADRAGREQALHRLERVFLPDAGVTGAGEHGAIAAATSVAYPMAVCTHAHTRYTFACRRS